MLVYHSRQVYGYVQKSPNPLGLSYRGIPRSCYLLRERRERDQGSKTSTEGRLLV